MNATDKLAKVLNELAAKIQPLKAEHDIRVQRALEALKELRAVSGKGAEPTRTEAEWHANGCTHENKWRVDLRDQAYSALLDWLTEQGFYS